ncbi:MAG: hypothetical protein P8Z49_10705 [Acidobacteriota bacterium]
MEKTYVVLEPDLGTALVIAAIGAGMMLVRGVPWRRTVRRPPKGGWLFFLRFWIA